MLVATAGADYLKTTKNYLADTPAVYMPIDPAQLQSLSAEQLLWMHRWIHCDGLRSTR